tara:strand:+ start:355 stop:1332 length:978 start_codon:yes stop_codon:yes gene_type:complete
MRSRVRFNDFDDINLNEVDSEAGQTQFFKNIKVLCKFNSKIHLVSYLHLQFINNLMLFIVVAGSFVSGLVDTVNHDEEEPNKNLKLTFGCIELFLAMIIAFYKQSKIAENQQDHYHTSNGYKILLNKINTDLLLINTNNSIYVTNVECIRDITDQFNNLIINAPIIPYFILKKYHIKDTDLGNNRIENASNTNDADNTNNTNNTNNEINQTLNQSLSTNTNTNSNNQIVDNSINVQILDPIFETTFEDINLKDNPINTLKNKNSYSPTKRGRKCSLNKSYSIKDLNSMKQDDLDNYNLFIQKINIKDEKKYSNNVINNFKLAFKN